ncbi:hypothetical protein QMK17_07170 [Rhodococcus sp. G-MC3]|uniref:hypothetical protein n=1 Tax=Rhodococcus sp. G-MC3 TaxID=3046209 RepID=UPI0024BBDC29|nr:hypothetical protein [Rhodococcus sp. G-MC3]MDJ0393110.1 hypothetical protein [Rhodococcus sp. G-MC3]
MTYALSSAPERQSAVHTVDIAGTAWPVYKVEALALGILVFLGSLALSSSLQLAVLASASSTVVAWWTLMLVERHSAARR